MMIFSVSFMNEFSHLLESQNSVTITDLLLCFSQFLPFFTIRFVFFSPHVSLGFFCSLHFKRWLLKDQRDRGSGSDALRCCSGGSFLLARVGLEKVLTLFQIGIFDFSIREHFVNELCEHSCVSIILN